jgi:endonuclease/exonuclease/phosphatase family metal-dependent hydrolase
VFETYGRAPARSFPAMLPVLHLDRIYVRGFRIKLAHVHRGPQWARVSDHAALSALLTRESAVAGRRRREAQGADIAT